ncbi:MAG: hypothetical protein COZ05_04190, partial [Armatimonadetes bacterium CG_4_10_14_3_um_filter_59_10]
TGKNVANPFAGYMKEILDTEGYLCRDELDLSARPLSTQELSGYDLVILTNVPLADHERDILADYVCGGGNLIASRPPKETAEVFGLSPAQSVVSAYNDGYITLNHDHPLAATISADCLQYHDVADLYQLTQAEALAWLTGKPGTKTAFPAVTINHYGDGNAAAFAFDLAASTVLFHQGCRLNASDGPNADANGDGAYKPDDLFFKFLDERMKTIPQADLHADLLVSIIRYMAERKKPIPRVWHYADAAPAVALIDGDSDGMTSAEIEKVIGIFERVGGKYTIYLMPEQYEAISPERFRKMRERGHDIGPHPFAGRMPQPGKFAARLADEVRWLAERYDYSPVAQRGHNVIWVGWTAHARLLLEQGLRLDTNFYAGPGFQHGYVNGSGLPVKFMDEYGQTIDVYEQASISIEDGLFTEKTLLPSMTVEECIELSITQIDEATDLYHSVYHPCFHPTYTSAEGKSSTLWLEAVAAHLQKRGIPFVNGREWVEFNNARRGVEFTAMAWDEAGGRLQFGVTSDRDIDGLTILLPATFRGRRSKMSDASTRNVVLEQREQLAVVTALRAGASRQFQVTYE